MRWAACGMMAVVGWAFTAFGEPARVPPLPARTEISPVVVGSGGCSARGCHGGRETAADGLRLTPDWHNAATNWLRHDPHPKAYRTLLTAKSRDIMRHLGGPADASADARCLACHSTPALADRPGSREIVRLRAEGVSCDACHTAPGRGTLDWLDAHTKGNAPDGLPRCYADGGMRQLDAVSNRAALCAGCHVGAAANPVRGVPVREVTHDLIAAGHPRLTFEYATFAAALPPHWSDPPQEHAAVRAWFAGQIASTKAGLLLLADQAERAAPWPELAAYSCFACHHDLTPVPTDGWRQRQAVASRAGGLGGLGALPWAGVSDPLRELLRDDPEFTRLHQELSRTLAKPGAAPAATAALARRLAGHLEIVPSPTPAAVVRGLRLGERDISAFDWDDAAQSYYALAAADRDAGGIAAVELRAAAAKLHLSRGESNSPRGFDPAAAAVPLRAAAEKLQHR
ncbi:MAG: multiheme c-type cytochrome [Fimbriiglobus sp.]